MLNKSFKQQTEKTLGAFAKTKSELVSINNKISARRLEIQSEQERLELEAKELGVLWFDNDKAIDELSKFIPEAEGKNT